MDSLSHAKWFLQHKRRAPLSLVVFLGAGLSIYVALVGAGRIAARERLVESKRALVAMQPAPLPDARNAALHWRNAFRARSGANNTTLANESNPLDVSPNSPARVHLAANAALLAAADQAADLPECNWDLDYSLGLNLPLPHLSTMRDCARICALRARVAAADNDWPAVLRSMKTMSAAADHVRSDPAILISVLVSVAIDSISAGSLEAALNTAGARPTQENLRGLLALVQSRHDLNIRYADSLRTDQKFMFHLSDQMGAGEHVYSDPFLFNWYSAVSAADQKHASSIFERLIASAEESEKTSKPSILLTPEQRDAEWQEESTRHRSFLLSSSMTPTFSRSAESVIQRRLAFRTMIVGITALLYRHENRRWPTDLNDLKLDPRFLADPSDSKNGTLKFKVDPDDNSFWVWSVGTDGVDNGSLNFFAQRKQKSQISAWREVDNIFHVPAVELK